MPEWGASDVGIYTDGFRHGRGWWKDRFQLGRGDAMRFLPAAAIDHNVSIEGHRDEFTIRCQEALHPCLDRLSPYHPLGVAFRW